MSFESYRAEIACPLCDWKHNFPRFKHSFAETEAMLRAHLESHDVLEWLKSLQKAKKYSGPEGD